MIVQHLRHPLEGIDFRPGFWGLEWSCPSPWQVPEGMKKQNPSKFCAQAIAKLQPEKSRNVAFGTH